MKLTTEKEREVFERMDDHLLNREYTCVASTDETASYRKREGAGPTINLFLTPNIHDPIKAVVSDLPLGKSAAWNVKGLAILVDQAEEVIEAR